MIVSYYVNLIIILISYPILSWNLITQMWNTLFEISWYFSVPCLPQSLRNYKEKAKIKPSEKALAMPGQWWDRRLPVSEVLKLQQHVTHGDGADYWNPSSWKIQTCLSYMWLHDNIINQINGLVQDCSISIANTMEIMQSYTKPSKCSNAYINTITIPKNVKGNLYYSLQCLWKCSEHV